LIKQYSDSNILLKRVRLQVKGDLMKKGFVSDEGAISYFLQADFVGGPTVNTLRDDIGNERVSNTAAVPILMDFWINLKFWEFFQLRAGQTLLPFGYEVSRNPYDLELVTYSLLYGSGQKYAGTQMGILPHLRDLGAFALGSYKGFNYNVGVVNGQGLNQTDSILLQGNKWKDLVGRVGYKHGNMLSVGASGYFGMEDNFTDIEKDRKKWFVGADLKLDYKNLLVLFEYAFGQIEMHNVVKEKADPSHYVFDPMQKQGFYLLAGYTFKTSKGDLQPLFRFDWYEYQKFTASGGFTFPCIYAVTVGMNYFFWRNEKNPAQNAKISLVYERMFPNDRAKVTYIDSKGNKQDVVEDQFILQLAAAF
jgi:hypothetical protein